MASMENPSPAPRLNVLVLSDARPGHFNKTKAVLLALRHHYKVCDAWYEVELRLPQFRRLYAACLNHTVESGGGVGWLRRFHKFASGDPFQMAPAPGLVLSAGGNTLYANVMLARKFKCPNVFIGGLRAMSSENFHRVIHHRPLKPSPPFLHWPVTLVDISPERLRDDAEVLAAELPAGEGPLWGLILGGDGGGFHFTEKDLSDLADMVRTAHQKHGVRWLIVSSRRTGVENERRLKARLDPAAIAAASWAGDGGANRYLGILGLSERLVCTEDSHMMLTEAIATGKPVLSVRPRNGEAANRDFLPTYERERLIHRQTIQEAAAHGCKWPVAAASSFQNDLGALGGMLADALTIPTRQP